MPADYKSLKITRPDPSGALKEELLQVYAPAAGTDTYTTSLDPVHILVEGDPLTLRFANANTGPSTITINAGTPIAIVKFDGTPVASGDIKTDMIATLLFDGVSFRMPAGGGGGSGSSAFNDITPGTNTTAAMVVSTGASLTVTGTGVIEANELKTNTATPVVIDGSAPTHEGQILISQPGNASAAWADPFVQGVYDPGTNTTTGGISGGPIKPVLIGGSDYTGTPLLHDLKIDTSGQLYIGNFPSSFTISSGTVDTKPALAESQRPGYTQGDAVSLSVDLSGFLRVRDSAASMLGDLVTSLRYNQVEINFSEVFDANLITNSNSGTAPAASQSDGQAVYATGTGTTGRSTGISVGTLNYRPGHEWYAYFTAAFTTPTDTVNTTYQRIGPASTTDGFYIGYELVAGVNTFCTSRRNNSADTHVKRSDFNADQCTGALASAYTSSGVPVAIDFTKINIFRLHGAWFGAAPIRLEVFSPDGIWVRMHTFLLPNTLTAPSTTTTTYNMMVDVKKTTADGTNLIVYTPCWAMGACDAEFLIKDPITDYTLAPITRSVLAGKTPAGTYGNVGLTPDNALTVGGSGTNSVGAYTFDPTHSATLSIVSNSFAYNTVSVEIVGSGGTISAGELTFEGSINNSNWVGIVGFNVGANTQMATAAYTLVVGTAVLLFNITGFNYFRARNTVVVAGTGTPQAIVSFALQGLASPSLNLTTGSITVASNQGAPNSVGNAWPVYITDNASHALTVNSSTPTGKYALDQNIVSILGTAPTTAGKLDIISLADTTIGGTTAPSKGLLILGKTADITPVYDPIPLAAGGGSVVISGSVAATLASETTKVIGVVRTSDGAGNLLTSNSSTPAGHFALDQNITSILGTAPSTAGKLDIITQADTTIAGTTAPSKGLLTLGKTADVTPAYDAIPLAAGGTSVITSGPTSTSASSTTHTAVSTASVQVLAANTSRKEVIVTNVGTTVIYLGLGATPTATDYHVALSGCSTANDGTGSVYVSDIWKGIVNAIGSAPAGSVVSAELT